MTIESVREYLKEHNAAVVRVMNASLSSDIALLNKINEKILSSGGKHLRPMLCLLVADALGEINESTYNFAAASEMLHNATLLHDDVADDSKSRRGMPTTYSVFGPTVSVLVGDFWLVKAMEAIIGNRACKEEIMGQLARTLSDLAEGEMLQMQKARSLDTTFEDYLRIIYCKTASLFEAVAVTGAASVDATKEQKEQIREYARLLGYAFQMKDDIFDYIPSSDIGKEVCVDILEKKITLPLLEALKNATQAERDEIISEISRIDTEPSLRNNVIRFVEAHDGVAGACKVLDDYLQKAKDCLAPLAPSKAKDCLIFLTNYVGERTL